MDWRMIEAAQTGNINAMYELIQEDPYVLEHIDQVPFVDTPLHVAACAGQVDFVMEMMNLKPSFARKLNKGGFTPMHLALQNEKIQVVLQLLKVDKGLVRVKGREGLTPLHHLARTGNLDLLIKFLDVCPEAIEDVTVRDETALHLMVKNDMFEAFEVLVGWLLRSRHAASQRWEEELLSWGDTEGNTVMHIAVIRNRPQVAKTLVENFHHDYINAKNLEGLTPVDILFLEGDQRQADSEIFNMLSNAGGLRGSFLPQDPNSSIASFKSKMSCLQKLATAASRGKEDIPIEMRNAFLVVTVLIITATFDASLNPPSKKDNSHGSESLSIMTVVFYELVSGRTVDLMAWLYNTVIFWAAIGLTAYLLPSRTICMLLLMTLSLFGSCYTLLSASVFYQLLRSGESTKPSEIWYHVFRILSYCFSSLISVLVAYRIAHYVFHRFIPRRKIFYLVHVLSLVCIAAFTLTPTVIFIEVVFKYVY
ncbi:ankyrin repeat-containing protein BDA1-like [Durio zibethinus]|uniref:Ankyrin repeat-containing protein BDA1-like n=1 Tax=Durio zibethinus TaxID=66656 RepID=A0A6P6AHD8_DURZI|nr:ankyrin repeat-containing protein BDA1-like [Durio zibethinus]